MYQTIKKSQASSALVQVQSLPRELVRSRSGVTLPSPFPVREETKSDELEVDANFDSSNMGYCEAYPDIGIPFVQTTNIPVQPSPNPLMIKSVFSPATSASVGIAESGLQADYAAGVARDHVGMYRNFVPPIGNAVRFWSKAPSAKDLLLGFKVTAAPIDFPIGIVTEIYHPPSGTWILWDYSVICSCNREPRVATNYNSAFITDVLTGGVDSYIRTLIAFPGPALGALANRRVMVETTLISDKQYQSNISAANWMFAHYDAIFWDSTRYAAWPFMGGLPDLAKIRNLGYELLCTYTGSRQLDGGKIAMALVPQEWSPLGLSPFDAVARVRHHKYSSALRDGAHGTWRVGSLDELNPQTPERCALPFQKLVVGYERNNAENQSMRLRSTGVFGVYSDSPIIGLAPYVPVLTATDLELLNLYFQYAPAVTENPSHIKQKDVVEFLKKTTSAIGSGVQSAAKFTMANPAILAPLALAMGQPEMAAALAATVKPKGPNPMKKQSSPGQQKAKPKAKQKK